MTNDIMRIAAPYKTWFDRVQHADQQASVIAQTYLSKGADYRIMWPDADEANFTESVARDITLCHPVNKGQEASYILTPYARHASRNLIIGWFIRSLEPKKP